MDVVGVATGDSVVLFTADEMELAVAETLVRVTLLVREVVMTVVESCAETTEAPAARTVRRMFEICILKRGYVGCDVRLLVDDLMCCLSTNFCDLESNERCGGLCRRAYLKRPSNRGL